MESDNLIQLILLAFIIGALAWSYRTKKARSHRFNWYVEGYFLSSDHLGSERSLYEKRKYGETFDRLSTRKIGLIIQALNNGNRDKYEQQLDSLITIFKNYNNPFFNDKSGHYANLVNSIYINETPNAHKLAEEVLFRSTEIQCVHINTVLSMINDEQDKEDLSHWKKKIRLRFNYNSDHESNCPWCQIGTDPELYQCPECGFKSSSRTSIKGLIKHWKNKHPDFEFPSHSACNRHSMYTVDGYKK
jgi:hypothetical protein